MYVCVCATFVRFGLLQYLEILEEIEQRHLGIPLSRHFQENIVLIVIFLSPVSVASVHVDIYFLILAQRKLISKDLQRNGYTPNFGPPRSWPLLSSLTFERNLGLLTKK